MADRKAPRKEQHEGEGRDRRSDLQRDNGAQKPPTRPQPVRTK